MSNIKIFVSCHKKSYVPKNDFLIPIQVGTALASERFDGYLHDDEGENISKKNKSYCELTAHYWAWKNCKADYYGFFHYRRYLCFNRNYNNVNGIYQLEFDNLSLENQNEICLYEEAMESCINEFDIIVPIKNNFKIHYQSNWEQYEKSPHLHIEDLEKMYGVLIAEYPEYKEAADIYLADHQALFCNMFIMKKVFFDEYSEFMFNVLKKTEDLIDFTNYSCDEYRVIGHLSERLLGIYLIYLSMKSDAKIGELRMVKINNTEKISINPAFREKNVTVAFSCSNHFAPYFGVLLNSIVKNSSIQNNYDIIVLVNPMSSLNRERLMKIVADNRNFSIRFFEIKTLVKDYNFSVKQHLAVETWYRLFLPSIMTAYDKVLYLDCDMIVMDDIAKLYDTDISSYMLAAARDLAIIGLYNYKIGNARNYIDTVLNLDEPYNYFQAGTVLLNLKMIREEYNISDLLELGQSRVWEWSDQDVLNIIGNGKTLILDQRWNVEHDRSRKRLNEMKRSPMNLFDEYLEARKDPKIIHYAGGEKPWSVIECDMAEFFWQYARNCVFYETIIARLAADKAKAEMRKNKLKQIDAKKQTYGKKPKMNWREKAKIYSLPLLPKGTKRREFVKKIYLKIFCPAAWSVRSDLKMHRKIWKRAFLNALHLNFLNKELLEFNKIKNRHSGERCFITCTGPSLQISDLEKLKNEYTFGVNSIIMAYSKTSWRPTYYAMVDIYNLGNFLKKNSVIGGEFSEREAFFHYRANIKYKTGKEKYCLINYSNHKKGRMKKNKYKLSENPGVCVYDCFTVTNMAIQLAIFMGFKEIYIIGADCNYDPKKMHFIETEIDNKHRNATWLPGAVELSIQGYRSAKVFAEKHGVKIFNATRGGYLEVFDRVDFDSIDFK